MRVLDLFSGLGGWGKPWAARGHEVVSVDVDAKFNPTICANIIELDPAELGRFDVVLASPPCEGFSVASIGHHWSGKRRGLLTPKTTRARAAMALVEVTLQWIRELHPRWFVIENPRGALRKLGLLDEFERVTVTFCQYGETRMKPTDLWGGFPENWHPRPACRNGAKCHERAPRGAKTGTQGIVTAAGRAKIPEALSLSICRTCEDEIHGFQ